MEYQETVVSLRPTEAISIDPACLAQLRDTDGAGHVDRMLGEALEDLALGLSRVAGAYRDDRFDVITEECIAIGKVASRVGLDRMGRVACTVAALAAGNDSVALSANLARLMRIGNDALGAIWDLQDQIV